MDFQKLQLFVDLAETLNYSDTAAENFTTQSNVSKKITALEKELDSQLFEPVSKCTNHENTDCVTYRNNDCRNSYPFRESLFCIFSFIN